MSKKLSGAQRRKLAREEEATTEALLKKVPKLTSYFAPSSSSAVISEPEHVSVNVSTPNEVLPDSESIDENINENEADKTISISSPKTVDIINSDPSSWPEFINKNERDELILKGPLPLKADNDYPKNAQNRHFSNEYQFRCAENGEKVKRKWLVYSEGSDSVYCFCCRLFEPNSKSQLGQKSGFNDWKHLAERLRLHETSPEHFKYMTIWLEAELRLKKSVSINHELMDQIRSETERWQEVFKRLVAIILYLAEHNIAFRGSSSKLFTKNNGNYLGLIELIGQFDGVMSDHLRRVTSSSSQVTLLGNNIQNELICLLGSEVKQAIIKKITKSKYFSVILDSTPDISHKDQISLTIRYVTEEDRTSGDIAVEESFIGYKVAKESTGEALSELLFEEIENCHLNMNDCRGQAYDNGANMAGINKGVQARVLKEYPRASFTPCTSHSLNLVVSDGAKSSVKSTSLFGIIQRIYTIFAGAGSTKRYCIISEHVQSLSIKQVCETRWEARISSIQAIRYQYAEVRQALIELSDSVEDPKTASEAQSLITHMEDFSFLTCLIVWHDLLFQVNLVSKTLQGKMADLTSAKRLLDNCQAFLASFREKGLVGAVISAKEIAEDIEIEPVFPTKPLRKKKKQFSYEGSDEVSGTPEEHFKRDVFLPLVDSVTTSLRERTEQLNKHHSLWGFLYDMGKLPEKEELKKCCLNLQEFLTFENISDINGKDLYNEIIHVKSIVHDEDKTNKVFSPIKVLKSIKSHDQKDLFTNLWVALRIMLTIPLTVASAERSFSKLKLIKTYLRSTMTQERLNALAILSIENDVAKKLDFKDILTSFAKAKARKIPLEV